VLTLKRGISPVAAIILVAAIAVAASVIVYVWHISFQSRLHEEVEASAGRQQEHENVMIKIEKIGFYVARSYNPPALQLWIWVRNVGKRRVTVSAIYVTIDEGKTGVRYGNIPVNLAVLEPGEASTNFIMTFGRFGNPDPPPPGSVVTVKVATLEGAEAVSSAIVPNYSLNP